MITIKIDNKVYTAKIKDGISDNAQCVSIYFENELMPIYGTRFSEMTSFEKVIMPWIKTKCESHANGKIDSIKIF